MQMRKSTGTFFHTMKIVQILFAHLALSVLAMENPDWNSQDDFLASFGRGKLIHGSQYFLHLTRAYDYVHSVRSGLEIEIQSITENFENFQQI